MMGPKGRSDLARPIIPCLVTLFTSHVARKATKIVRHRGREPGKPLPPSPPMCAASRARAGAWRVLGPPESAASPKRSSADAVTPPVWRPEAESNRCTRICSPLHSHSAIRPGARDIGGTRLPGQGRAPKTLEIAPLERTRKRRRVVTHILMAPRPGPGCMADGIRFH